jgi:diacylglycerol kinase
VRAVRVDDRERGVERVDQAAEARAAEVRMLVHARGDQRVGDLQKERRGPAEEQKALAIDAARHGVSREDAFVAHTTSVLLRSFAYAFAGVAYILRTQPNARIELAIGAAAIALGLWLGLSAVEWAVLAITITLVVGLEWINTSLELAVTLASPERHPQAKAAKDVAAGVVLLGAIGSVIVGLLIFGPRLVSRFIAP